MPTTRMERTIQSVISLKHRWRNPLERMRSSAIGLHPLPIELWEEIFAIATDAAAYWAETERSWCTISNPFFTAKEEGLLRDPMARDNQRLLRTRHSIILVCKSWYFMGIPILWSHLQFDEKDLRNIVTMIYSVLKRNPTLAAHVLRITIKPEGFRQNSRHSDPIKPEKLDTVAKFVRLLTNIEAISCSLPYAAHLNPSIQPGIVMLNNQGLIRQDATYDASISIGPQSRDSFWIHCRTLSLTLTWNFGDIGPVTYDRREIKFDNLIDLRLNVSQTAFLEWIQECWSFPALKNLHIITHPLVDHMQIIRHTHLTVEKLYIGLDGAYTHRSPRVVMPNLKEIYLNDNGWYIKRTYYWFTFIKAPALRRFTMTWDPYLKQKLSTRSVILSIIAKIFSHYSSLKELVIIVPMGKWVHSSGEDSQVILLLEDIMLWCKSVTVEMVTGKHAERIRYGKGSLPIDDLDALEYDRSIYTGPDL